METGAGSVTAAPVSISTRQKFYEARLSTVSLNEVPSSGACQPGGKVVSILLSDTLHCYRVRCGAAETGENVGSALTLYVWWAAGINTVATGATISGVEGMAGCRITAATTTTGHARAVGTYLTGSAVRIRGALGRRNARAVGAYFTGSAVRIRGAPRLRNARAVGTYLMGSAVRILSARRLRNARAVDTYFTGSTIRIRRTHQSRQTQSRQKLGQVRTAEDQNRRYSTNHSSNKTSHNQTSMLQSNTVPRSGLRQPFRGRLTKG